MCTVTYLPWRDGFILTHNRDEAPTRSPWHISREKRGGDTLIFPKDIKAGGGWVAAARSGRVACLLNGAFLKHQHQPPYRRSRGLVLLDFFDWPHPDHFFARYDLAGIEPFTFLFFTAGRVAELRWDGAQRHLRDLSPAEPHFWCSATLYPPPMQALREQIFRQWLARFYMFPPNTLPAVSEKSDPASSAGRPLSAVYRLPSSIHHLHLMGSVGDPENDYVMNRGGRVCTVSITQILFRESQIKMRYTELLEGHGDQKQIRLAGR